MNVALIEFAYSQDWGGEVIPEPEPEAPVSIYRMDGSRRFSDAKRAVAKNWREDHLLWPHGK